jgi:hypothetical protein
MNKDHLLPAAIVAIVVLLAVGVGSVLKQTVIVPGPTNTTESVVPVNQYVGGGDTQIIDPEQFGAGGGTRVINNRLKVGSSGAEIVSILFATGTRNFDSLTSEVPATSTTLTVTGADVGDPCFVSKDSAMSFSNFGTAASTSTVSWSCSVVLADTASIEVANNSTTTAMDLPSGTVGVVVFDIN